MASVAQPEPTKQSPAPAPSVAEFTVRAVLLGLLIGVVMTAANTYLGLYAGMTVSASIPAAIVSMGLLRGVLRQGTILENNIVQTMASAGESVAAGIIFTVPALVITGAWTEFSFWKVSAIAVLGGILGVLFMIPLRRTLIVEDKELIYPEGVACAQVLEAGETGGNALRAIFASLAGGAIFKGLIGFYGVLKATAEAAVRLGGTVLYFGTDVSVALLGVGVIVGLEVASLVFLGGVLGWLIGIPIYYSVVGGGAGESAVDAAWGIWSSQIRYIGVGSMIVGGLWSMWSIRGGMVRGLKQALRAAEKAGASVARTEQDLGKSYTTPILGFAALATIGLYFVMTESWVVALTAGVIMVAASFFFVAVSSYIVGLVGTSNNPVSGMTICALMFSAGILLIMGLTGTSGIVATLGVAGVVCVAAATAGDCSQDLKTGFLVKGTPWRQQLAQFLGVTLPVLVIAPILTLLHSAYGIGGDGPEALRAPQATLFASITEALFNRTGLPWVMVGIGAVLAVVLIATDEVLKRRGSSFRTHVMAVAVGIYLPLALSVPIFLGGLVAWALSRLGGRAAELARNHATLIGSGLIAGEAIAGILIAVIRTLPQTADWVLPIPVLDSHLVSAAAILAAAVVIWYLSRQAGQSASAS